MTDQALLLSALLLPLAGAAGIMLCDRWPNLREAVTLVTAGALGLIVINIYLRLQAGAMLAIDLAEYRLDPEQRADHRLRLTDPAALAEELT